MINLNDIANVKLKHVEKPIEKSSLDYKKMSSSECSISWLQLENENLSRYRQNQILAQLDQWIPLVPSELTFDTLFIDIEKDVALLFIEYHEKLELFHQHSVVHPSDHTYCEADEFVNQLLNSMKKENSIQKLQQQIDECRLWNKQVRSPLFFKLSSRSPKDVTRMNDKNVDDLFEQDLNDHYTTELKKQIIPIEFYLSQELQQNFFKVYQDLIETYVDFWNESSPTKNKIALREWDPTIDIRFELRTFVVNSKLRACSQYNHVIYVEELEKYQFEIRALIHETIHYLQENFFKGVFTTYVADFVIYPKFF
ncbi:hypothetical protein FDP41_010433 [Naegleria fowleri]|uniref:Uncharacterized protein n=1 Tax=Naegleria fowleri TaxID=5763 RepID=A0A6A5CCV7_NAEFO|nr:uncharacterized protein FDP41_010433 [Naegleria fowleri]KAF0983368.1 hypothetical protein FDP41_010433 [Naegleria fowleri]